jgi:hypothetical protein
MLPLASRFGVLCRMGWLDKAAIVDQARALDGRERALGGLEPLAGHDIQIAQKEKPPLRGAAEGASLKLPAVMAVS